MSEWSGVLLISPSGAGQGVLRDALAAKHINSVVVENFSKALEQLKVGSWDAVILPASPQANELAAVVGDIPIIQLPEVEPQPPDIPAIAESISRAVELRHSRQRIAELESAQRKTRRRLRRVTRKARSALEELRAARDAAEAANRAKDQFLSVLSHELRTPLTPVLTTISALQIEPGISPQMCEDLEMVRRNVELEARLIEDLLDLTRIAKGKLRLNLQTVDAHATVQSAIEICRPEIAAKGLTITTSLGASQHHVRADAVRLHQVFWNLLRNAVKFTQDTGRIHVVSENRQDQIRVEIHDTGIGIPADVMPRLFFAFEQAEQSITRRFGGLGLGLAISKSLIDMHGGKLDAHSEGPDKGSVFAVDLAIADPPTPGEITSDTKKIRILMVDDHLDTRVALKRLLERKGHSVHIADSIQSALAASERPFDLLISDIGLPDGSGLDLMRHLLGRRPIRGIALSGFGMEEDIRKSKEAGFAEHFIKPINFNQLEEAIQSLAK